MSFFKDFKEDLSQAVNELVSDEEIKDTKQEEEENTEDETSMDDGYEEDFDLQMLNELLSDDIEEEDDVIEEQDEDEVIEEPEEVEILQEEPEVVENEVVENEEIEEEKIYSKEDDKAMEEAKRMEEEAKEATKEALRGNRNPYDKNDKNEIASMNTSDIPADEITEITKGTAIEGNIICEGSMNVNGKIKGNVACRGKLVVCGTIVGASRAAEIYTNNAKIDGDVTSDGSIKIGNGSIIIGNVYGTSAVIGGAVKGDIDVHGPVVIDGTAVVQGNIRSRSVQINNGAAIEGSVSQCYAEIDYAALFDKTFAK
ncbi:MAG: polymer-forming cytoskeletal protein [Lachnospiraceae bacterium]|nr:polymer-forming cytoskeletal protein [Lachnospiraceae bacterium]MDE6253665.1 polymer-forming cytoskeletal protein [Lachnospiraceae bacterium]